MQNVTREIALEEDDAATGWRGLALLLLISVAAHVALFGGLGRAKHHPTGEGAQEAADRGDRDGRAAPARAHPARGEARPEAGRAQDRGARPGAAARTRRRPRRPQAETPADFSGTTLTNDGPGEGWASAVGNGEAMHGPIGRPGAKVTNRAQDGAPTSRRPRRPRRWSRSRRCRDRPRRPI